ncbi:hypothetical protein VHEMI06460 [[Torrubiella] hemipterigena]|uniref:Uncharacterized protein n=1 Tax=[Torrubiella] hemipterigena TaxID=1531966 RepID=A0A0A1T0R5_9HYPO|nr:hypothetical protein VHEMI06460 [[Torrubiella] hemipterigena]
MHLRTLVLPILVPSAALAQRIVKGTIYNGIDNQGVKYEIITENCINLRKPLLDEIHSIDVTEGFMCRIYTERGCDDEGSYREYYETELYIPGGNAKAVKCMRAE